MTCNHPTRNGTCRLDSGHKGQHRVAGVWCCDSCGRMRHGAPAAVSPDGEFPGAMRFCIVCIRADERRKEREA